MCSKPKSCVVCLKNDHKLIEASEADSNNIKWKYKLEFCVPEVEWNEYGLICCPCTEQLNAACSFRNLCLQSNGFTKQLTNLRCPEEPLDDDQGLHENKSFINSKESSDFTCYVCFKSFAIKASLVDHVQLHSNHCDLCKEQFTTSTQLQLHNVQVHAESKQEPSECRFCSRTFKSPVSLNQHIRRMHRKEPSNCDSPTNSIDNTNIKIDLKTESLASIAEEKFNADSNYDSLDNECFSSGDKSVLGQHNEDYLAPDVVRESKRKKTESKACGRANFLCDQCKHVFISSKKLLDHVVSEHGFDRAVIKPFGCDKCDSKFSSSSNLLQHKKYHVGKRTHICTFCGKGYITKSDLNTHEKQHLNKREYQCMACPKTFNTHKDLRSHKLVVHTDPSLWNYVCTFCQKRFPIKSNLDQHMRRHTGEKRFGCHICDKRFVDKIVMQKHIKSHSNFRAHKCEHCDKEYKDSKVLEVHLTKVHGIGNAKIPIRVKKHFCHVCPKSYFAKNKLTRHMFSHTGEKPYVCHICERKFTDKSYVKQHLKTTHNVLDVDEDK